MTHPRRQIRTFAAARGVDRVLTRQPMPEEPDSLPAEFIAALQPPPPRVIAADYRYDRDRVARIAR